LIAHRKLLSDEVHMLLPNIIQPVTSMVVTATLYMNQGGRGRPPWKGGW